MVGLVVLAVAGAVALGQWCRAGVAVTGTGTDDAEVPDAQLREQVERAWAQVSILVDRLIGSGQLIDRELLLDLARFLESAMPAVVAYERLLARVSEESDLAVLLALPGRERA